MWLDLRSNGLTDVGKGELDFGGDDAVSTDHIKIPDNKIE